MISEKLGFSWLKRVIRKSTYGLHTIIY
jgi:hypothetical protein